jgi:hypothetical protein
VAAAGADAADENPFDFLDAVAAEDGAVDAEDGPVDDVHSHTFILNGAVFDGNDDLDP